MFSIILVHIHFVHGKLLVCLTSNKNWQNPLTNMIMSRANLIIDQKDLMFSTKANDDCSYHAHVGIKVTPILNDFSTF